MSKPRPDSESTPTVDDDLKTCRKCGERKPKSEYHKAKKGAGGLNSRCKVCWYAQNEVYRKSHNEQYAGYTAAARAKDPEKFREKRKLYRAKNRHKDREYERRYRKKYPDKHRAKVNAHNSRHRKALRDYYNAMYAADPERAKRRRKAWALANPERAREIMVRGRHRRRQRQSSAPCTLTSAEWNEILRIQRNRCARCRKKFGVKRRPHRDHVIPVSKGGGLIFENVQALCRRCNGFKHTNSTDYRGLIPGLFF